MLLHVKKSLKLPNIIWKHSAHGKQTYRKHMPSQNHHVHTLRQSRDKPEMNGINAKCIRTNGDRGVRSIAVTHTSYTSFFSIPGDAACILKRCSAIAGTPYDWQIDEHVRFVHVLCVFFFLFFFRWKHVNMIDIINASFPAGRRRYTHSYTRLCCIRQNKRRERKGSHFVASTACAIQQTLCVYKYTNICCAFDKYTVINIAFGPTDLMQLGYVDFTQDSYHLTAFWQNLPMVVLICHCSCDHAIDDTSIVDRPHAPRRRVQNRTKNYWNLVAIKIPIYSNRKRTHSTQARRKPTHNTRPFAMTPFFTAVFVGWG